MESTLRESVTVSIIIPMYNGERYIERCLRSIQNQTFRDFEVLLIDDGSKDHTAVVAKRYAASDARFRYVYKNNSGVSDSRNMGITLAKGEFLQFVDVDDWLPKNAVAAFVNQMQPGECEMAISGFYRVTGANVTEKGHIGTAGIVSRQTYASYMMKAPANFYYGVLWNKMYRRSIITEKHIRCAKDLNWCEDFRFNMEYLQYAVKIAVICEPLYYYVKNRGSLCDTQINLRALIKTKRMLFDYYKDLYQSMDLYEENKVRIQMFYLAFAHDKTMEKRQEKKQPDKLTDKLADKLTDKLTIKRADKPEIKKIDRRLGKSGQKRKGEDEWKQN